MNDQLPEGVTAEERAAWWQLFDSVANELGLGPFDSDPRRAHDWLDCCLMHGPLHADDCPTLDRGTHRQ